MTTALMDNVGIRPIGITPVSELQSKQLYKQLYVYSIALIPAPCFNYVRLLGATAERRRDHLSHWEDLSARSTVLTVLLFML